MAAASADEMEAIVARPDRSVTARHAALAQLNEEQHLELREQILREVNKPLTVAIMGQTGVGKSSLLNALFNTDLRVGDIRPTTKVPEPIVVPGDSGPSLVFWDMPGIGESLGADRQYLEWYRQKIAESDVAVLAIHSDTRSTLFDSQALVAMLAGVPQDEQRSLVTKLSFVLTKADLITPPAWIYMRDGDAGKFVPSKPVRRRLDEKASYFQQQLIRPHGGLSTTQTYMSDGFDVVDGRFQFDEYSISYDGFMSDDAQDVYTRKYPEFAEIFERLARNHRVVSVSAHFRYNLVPLLITIVNKLPEEAIGRFQRLTSGSAVTSDVRLDVMKAYGNIVIWDMAKGRKAFDLEDVTL